MIRPILFTAFLLIPLLFGGLPGKAEAAGFADANRAIVDRHILPGYDKLAAANRQLDQAAGRFCATPDAAGLDSLRAGFHRAMDAWQSIRHIRFGPVELFLRHHRFQIWPDRRNSVGKQLAGLIAEADPKVDDPALFAQASVAVQGLSALERLLFGASVSLDQFREIYRCRLLRAITRGLDGMSAELLTEWSRGDATYRHTLTRPGPDNPVFDSHEAVSGRLLNELYTALTEMEELKLGKPMGENRERARSRKAESWRSGRSLRNLRLDLAALRDLYQAGFEGLIGDPALREKVNGAFDRAETRLAGLPGDALGPLLESAGGWKQLRQAQQALDELRQMVSAELSPALGLPLGFNSLDGD